MQFVKLFSSIFNSSIWEEDPEIRIVWITILLLKGPDQIVRCNSLSRLAALANVPLPSVEKAIQKFLAPDPSGHFQQFQGKRIKEIPGGWLVLNGEKYAQLMRREYNRKKQADYRARKSVSTLAERLEANA